MTMTELVDVVVKAPSDRVADLYAMVAQLNRPKQDASTSSKGETPGDLQDLVRMFRELAQDLFRHAA
jgi:hypothetical protein